MENKKCVIKIISNREKNTTGIFYSLWNWRIASQIDGILNLAMETSTSI